MIEREILNRLAAAKIRLRDDKVVHALIRRVQAALTDFGPEGQAFLFTCTAPIRQAGKTARVLEGMIREGASAGEAHGNQLRVRRVTGAPPEWPKIAGFVHNPGLDAGRILDIAEASLSSSRS